jgi:DNA-binding response OmpR family regulator
MPGASRGGDSGPGPAALPISRVLIVDDEVIFAQALGAVLERHGYVVSVVQSAAAAKRALAEGMFDCLVLDYGLPDLRGDVLHAFAVAYQPRLARRTLFITGSVTDDVARAMAATGSVWLRKPFEMSAFVDLVGWLARGDELVVEQ